jgi:hypothetical protein
VRIVDVHADRHSYRLLDPTREALLDLFDAMPRDVGFGNGRTARQVFQRMTERHAMRLAKLPTTTPEELSVLLPADVPTGER